MSEIESLAAQGLFESSGCFTLNVEQQCAKLVRWQLPPGLFWNLWLQAGVGLGSQSLRLDPAPTPSLTMLGSGPCPLRTDNLWERLSRPLEWMSSSPESSLFLGILASQWPQPQPLSLELKSPEGGLVIQVQNRQIFAHPTPAQMGDWSLQLTLPLGQAPSASLGSAWGFCPVPLSIQGQPLTCPWLKTLPHPLAEGYWESEGPRRLALPDPETCSCFCYHRQGQYRPGSQHSPRTFLLHLPGRSQQWDTGLALVASEANHSQGTVHWVKSGMVIESEDIDFGRLGVPLRLEAVVSAHFLPADLSQLRLVRDLAYQARLARLREQAFELLEAVRHCSLTPKEGHPWRLVVSQALTWG